MKKPIHITEETNARSKGQKISVLIHIVLLGLMAFPFMQATIPYQPETTRIVMDFSSGSSQAGAIAQKFSKKTSKAAEKEPISNETLTTTSATEKVIQKIPETTEVEEAKQQDEEPTKVEPETGVGAADSGAGDSIEGGSSNGAGRGFIEGSGALTRTVIDRGNTKELAQQNGRLVLKICINRRGYVTYAEWDKDASSIKDSKVARTALDNVLEYRFEKDRQAPVKECGRLTYIIEV